MEGEQQLSLGGLAEGGNHLFCSRAPREGVARAPLELENYPFHRYCMASRPRVGEIFLGWKFNGCINSFSYCSGW